MQVDMKEAKFANDLLRRLSGDYIMNGEAATVEGVLNQHAVTKNGQIDLTATADKLIKSLNELLPDEGKIDPKTHKPVTVKEHKLSPEGEQSIRELIENSGAKTTAELAKVLQQKDLKLDKNDPNKKESLFQFLYRTNTFNDSSFAVAYTGKQLWALREFLNSFTPGLGDTLTNFLNKAGIVQNPSDKPSAASRSLAEGFNVVHGGSQQTLAEFYGQPLYTQDANGNSIFIKHNPFRGPTTEHQISQFLNGEGPYAKNYNLGGTSPLQFKNQSFDEIILKRWEQQGIVKFDSPEGRDNFKKVVGNALLGRPLKEDFINEIGTIDGTNTRALLTFDNETAKKEFAQSIAKIRMDQTDPETAARQIIDAVGKTKGVSLNFEIADLKKDFKGDWIPPAALTNILGKYAPARNGQSFAERIIEDAEKYNAHGFTLNTAVEGSKPRPRQTVPHTSAFTAAANTATPASPQPAAPATASPAVPPPTGPSSGPGGR